MGVILSRFRTKLSTKEVLEEIEKKLKSIDEFQQDTMERQKRVARRLLVIFVLVYIAAIMAFVFISSIQKFKLYYFTGLVVFALVCWLSHKGLKWYYNRQMISNSEKSVELRKKKKKILEEVMDTETYKVAKEILDRFGDKPQPTLQLQDLRRSPVGMNKPMTAPGTELRQRQVESRPTNVTRANVPAQQPPATPMNPANSAKLPQQQQMLSAQRPVAMNYGQAPLRPLPRPILPRERGVLDRMMDFFVGDGPHQRYALICRHCGGHNGMALQEEFEYVSYNCCYCYQFNPPRKMRPMGPRLPVPPPPQPPPAAATPSPSVKPMGESKSEPILTEAKPDEHSSTTKPGSGSEGSAGTPSVKDEEDEEESSASESEEEVSEKMDVDVQEGDSTISDSQETSSLR